MQKRKRKWKSSFKTVGYRKTYVIAKLVRNRTTCCLCVFLSVCNVYVCLDICLAVCLSACTYICLPVYLSAMYVCGICLSVISCVVSVNLFMCEGMLSFSHQHHNILVQEAHIVVLHAVHITTYIIYIIYYK